ncbi:hypothetical protein LG3211_3929 [Lysobacter gummosus]|nr:hypothetical protein LG3211_3929 [Lysobacter gummosus]
MSASPRASASCPLGSRGSCRPRMRRRPRRVPRRARILESPAAR